MQHDTTTYNKVVKRYQLFLHNKCCTLLYEKLRSFDRGLRSIRQRLKFVMRSPELKIPTLVKWLISPLVRVITKICKKHLVLKTISNINIYNETGISL